LIAEIRERLARGKATNDDAKYLNEALETFFETGLNDCDCCIAQGKSLCENQNCIDAIMVAAGKAEIE